MWHVAKSENEHTLRDKSSLLDIYFLVAQNRRAHKPDIFTVTLCTTTREREIESNR